MKCPKIEQYHFRFLYCFWIDHVVFFWNAPLFYVRFFWNAPFFLSDSENGKNGAFQKIRTWKSGAFQKISTWSILKLKMNRKWNSSILGHFKKLRKCYHMTKSSFTCFLGHFMIPRVSCTGLTTRFAKNNSKEAIIMWSDMHSFYGFDNFERIVFSYFLVEKLIWKIQIARRFTDLTNSSHSYTSNHLNGSN